MHLSIRWKFILSIGITLIITYLGLLTWDYWWQRSTAAADMQQRVAEIAQGLANTKNAEFSGYERQIETIADAIERYQPQNIEALSNIPSLRLQGQRNNPQTPIFIAFEPDFAATAKLESGYLLAGGRGQGRGGRGGGGPRGDGRGGPDGRGPGFFGGRGGPRQDGPGGPPPGFDQQSPGNFRPTTQNSPPNFQLESLINFDRTTEPFYLRAAELKRPVWCDPHIIRARPVGGGGGGGLPRATYSYPIIIGERFVGVVAAAVPISDPGGPFGGRGGRGNALGRFGEIAPPSTEPATRPADPESDGIVDDFSIIGNEGRVIFPLAPRNVQRASIVDWAKANGLNDLANDLRSTFDGDNTAVKVYRLHDVPDLIPGALPGENYWVAFAPIAATDWVVTSAISESQHMSPIIQRLWHRALFLVGGLVVLLGMTAFISIRVSRPIEKMARAVNELASGNLDARVSEVTSQDELGQLATAFNTMTGQLKQHVAALTEQTAAREKVEAELRIARQIQTDLLPKTFPPFPNRNEFDLHAINVPARQVAGDFYDFFFVSADVLAIVIADVSGKGVPAALLMAVTRTIIRNLAMEGLSPAQIAERANAMLLQDISDSMFVTMFLCLYDTRSGRVTYVNAGHPKPYVFGASGEPMPFGEITGALLGVNPVSSEWVYEQREAELAVGQTLLLYTDGVTEARSPDGSMLRAAGVEKLLHKHEGETVSQICLSIVDELNEYQAGQPADDITVLALQRKI